MKKGLWILFFILIVGIGIFLFAKKGDQNQESKSENYVAQKTGINVEEQHYMTNEKDNNIEKNKENEQNEEISEYTTKLPKDTKERYSNIELACDTLNGTTIKTGESFSLWKVLGCPTEEKGYRKAKTFTSNGGITKSYGGGICQVSTTIYNAVLNVDGLEIEERHEHSRDVVYIKDGKDAAVSYKSADLKFKNTLEYDVKIEAKLEENKVKIKLIRI